MTTNETKVASLPSPLRWGGGGGNGRGSKGDFFFCLLCGRREINELITSLMMDIDVMV
jgi:hypothetical protein